MPVYVVQPENDDNERVVHQSLRTQCMFLPVERAEVVTEDNSESEEHETTNGLIEWPYVEETNTEAGRCGGKKDRQVDRDQIVDHELNAPRRNMPRVEIYCLVNHM